jgi:hypothetical protein
MASQFSAGAEDIAGEGTENTVPAPQSTRSWGENVSRPIETLKSPAKHIQRLRPITPSKIGG